MIQEKSVGLCPYDPRVLVLKLQINRDRNGSITKKKNRVFVFVFWNFLYSSSMVVQLLEAY